MYHILENIFLYYVITCVYRFPRYLPNIFCLLNAEILLIKFHFRIQAFKISLKLLISWRPSFVLIRCMVGVCSLLPPSSGKLNMDQVDVEVVGKKRVSDIEELMAMWPIGAWIWEKDRASEDQLGVTMTVDGQMWEVSLWPGPFGAHWGGGRYAGQSMYFMRWRYLCGTVPPLEAAGVPQ